MAFVNQTSSSNSQYQATLVKFPDLKYMGQEINLPSINMPPLETFPHSVDYTIHADRLLYAPISFSFIVDDNFNNYTNLFEWMKIITQTDNAHLTEFTQMIIILYNRQYNAIKRVTFENCFCTGLSGLQLSSVEDDSMLVCTATFDYSEFKIEDI